jgi:proteasome lid subunit RPN8/RPN11
MNSFRIMLWKTFGPKDLHLLWQKAFSAQVIFEQFVQETVNRHRQLGHILPGEQYSALITPHYYRVTDHTQHTLKENSSQAGEANSITVQFDEPIDTANHVHSFTLNLRVPARSLALVQDFEIHDVTFPFFRRIAPELVMQGIVHNGDRILPLLYITQDDDTFTKIVIELSGGSLGLVEEEREIPAEVRSLVELLPEDDDEPVASLPTQSLKDYPNRVAIGPVDDGALMQIVVAREAFEQMQAVARADTNIEQGGILVGQPYTNADVAGGYIVNITNHILAESARGTHVQLRYTFEDWQRQNELLKAQYSDKRIVGWYHTHLVKAIRIDAMGRQFLSELFFSEDDIFIHTQFFKEPWYVALVLNPRGEPMFFKWANNRIVEASGFHLV